MNKDRKILKQLWKEIGKQLTLIEFDRLDTTLDKGYAVDERGYVVGVNLCGLEYLESIPKTLFAFKYLKTLSFYSVKIHDFSRLENIPGLLSLTIFSNPIDDISFLQELRYLTKLNLQDDELTDISVLHGLSNLKRLYLHHNQLTDISVLQGLSNLTNLGLADNQLTDISVLQGLSNLTDLVLSENRLTDISVLQGLKNLTSLDLRENKIKKLPEAIVDLGMEIDVDVRTAVLGKKGIYLYGNPLETPPPEIIRKGKKAIKAYFKSLEKGKLPLNEVKVLLVGDGGAGKTSLVKRLLGKRFNKKEAKTHGIDINQWEVKQQKTFIKTHLWDFGGQEIMHATHQFFLSKRSLYILVLDGRKDEKTEYWLKHIRSFGGDSPVVVVLNKIDENPGFDVNRRFLLDKYNNIKGFFRLSCANKTGIDEFTEALKKALCDVEIIRTTWAENWFHVKEQLEKMIDPFISLERYKEICLDEKIEEKSGQDTLVDFLHDLGIILHFDDLGLKDVHVLEPKWVTEAVYKIINSPIAARHKGILKPAFLDKILKQNKRGDYYYPPDKYHYIIELMKKFEICYQLEKGEVLIPDLLEVEESEFKFDYAGSLKFLFEYDFLPRSVMPRFIVRMHNDIKENCRWRTGVLLENKVFDAQAVVKADNEEKKIFIYVSGQEKRDYFSVIRFTLRDINAGFEKINAVEKVPLPGSETIAVKYKELTGLKRMGKSVISIGELGQDIPIDVLLEGIELKEEQRVGEAARLGNISAARDVNIFNMKGDHSTFNLNITQVEQKLELIIQQLEEHRVPGREEFIKQLRDDEVKKDKKKLRSVLGKILTRTAEVGTIASAIASLL